MKYVIKKGGQYWPSEAMKKIAWVSDPKIYEQADRSPARFWSKLAKEGITWQKPWQTVYEESFPYFRWFKGGKLNFCFNCLDRHIAEGKGSHCALIWVPEPLAEKTVKLTYHELRALVNKTANVFKKLGVKKGDVVAIYLPMIPEALISMLACARIGAAHSVVFSAFSADALRDRIKDGRAKLLVTADGYYRRGKEAGLLDKAAQAINGTPVKKVLVVKRLGTTALPAGGQYLDFKQEVDKAEAECAPVMVNSEDMMFILYTSGTTGQPKGIVHDTGGYAAQAYWTAKWYFNLRPDDIMWCTADVGWITGHTYGFYGPLLNGITTLIYEGSPDFPDLGRWWRIIEQNKATVFYTAPTAIRMFKKAGDEYVKKYDLSALRILGTVGEPIDVDSWDWYFKKIGGGRCPLIDTWWQTETGGVLIGALPGIGPFVPGVAGRSFPGTRHAVVDERGGKAPSGASGFLVQKRPFAPGMMHGVYRNPGRYIKYFVKFKGQYDTSDGAFVNSDGLFRITGRTDDTMKVAGHRLSTAELENAIDENELVSECAVVPIPDELKGEVPVAFVVLKKGEPSEELAQALKKHVDLKIGPTARPAKIYFVEDLPKTRSGKIMRRILKNILNNEETAGLMTLVNPDVVDKIRRCVSNSLV